MTLVKTGVAVDGRKAGALTPDAAAQALRDYYTAFNELPVTAAFNPATARSRSRADLVERYAAGNPITGRPWPSLNAIKGVHNGSFDAAMIAAGLPLSRTGPKRRALIEAETRLADGDVDASTAASLVVRQVEMRERAEAEAATIARQLTSANRRLAVAEAALQASRERARARAGVTPAQVRSLKAKLERAVGGRKRAEARATAMADQLKAAEREVRALRADRAQLERELEALRGRVVEVREVEVVREVPVAGEAVVREVAVPDQGAADLRRDLRAAERARDAAVAKATKSKDAEQSALKRARQAEARADAAVASAEADREALSSVKASVLERAAVKAAERERDAALERAAEAEAAMVAQGRAVLGEARALTATELDELRARGPAGPAVMAAALRDLAKARGSGSAQGLQVALGAVASAAVMWRDRVK